MTLLDLLHIEFVDDDPIMRWELTAFGIERRVAFHEAALERSRSPHLRDGHAKAAAEARDQLGTLRFHIGTVVRTFMADGDRTLALAQACRSVVEPDDFDYQNWND